MGEEAELLCGEAMPPATGGRSPPLRRDDALAAESWAKVFFLSLPTGEVARGEEGRDTDGEPGDPPSSRCLPLGAMGLESAPVAGKVIDKNVSTSRD